MEIIGSEEVLVGSIPGMYILLAISEIVSCHSEILDALFKGSAKHCSPIYMEV